MIPITMPALRRQLREDVARQEKNRASAINATVRPEPRIEPRPLGKPCDATVDYPTEPALGRFGQSNA